MICPNCQNEMEVQNCLVSRTTDPKDDDSFEDLFVCDKCDHYEPIINLEDEDE